MDRTHALFRHKNRSWLVIVFLFWSAWSASGQVTVQGPLTHEVELLPGGSHSGIIVLQNTGNRTEEVKLYQTDYRSQSPGQHFYEDPGTSARSNADWISTSPKRFTVPPGERYGISYVMEVPGDPSLSGTYWSVLMIEPVPAQSPESYDADPEKTSVGIITLLRYAVRFVTHIGTTGTFQPEISGVNLTLVEDTPTLGIDIANIGSRLLAIEIWAELYDPTGNLVARRDGSGASLYPDSSRQYQIGLDGVGPGEYTALVVIDAGDNNVYGTSFPLALE